MLGALPAAYRWRTTDHEAPKEGSRGPIVRVAGPSRPVHVHRLGPDRPVWLSGAAAAPGEHRVLLPAGSGRAVGHAGGARQPDRAVPGEIGRASCRKGWRSWGERGGGEERESDE